MGDRSCHTHTRIYRPGHGGRGFYRGRAALFLCLFASTYHFSACVMSVMSTYGIACRYHFKSWQSVAWTTPVGWSIVVIIFGQKLTHQFLRSAESYMFLMSQDVGSSHESHDIQEAAFCQQASIMLRRPSANLPSANAQTPQCQRVQCRRIRCSRVDQGVCS